MASTHESGAKNQPSQRLLLIDTDAGTDDAQAILMALSDPGVKVIGITTVHGNVGVDQVAKNVLRITRIAGKEEVPIHVGCHVSLIGTRGDASSYHGKDGLGDAPDNIPPDESRLQTLHSVHAILSYAQQYSGQLELVCLGPLTNIAMALRLCSDLGQHFKKCYIMGGNTTGQGNITAAAEYNFHTDPEAAYIVLNELHCDILLVGWEITRDNALSWDFYDKLRAVPSEKSAFLGKINRTILAPSKANGWNYVTCDEVIMACVLEPDMVTDTVFKYTTVNLEGHLLKGQMMIDWTNMMKKKPNCTTVLNYDIEMYKKILFRSMQ